MRQALCYTGIDVCSIATSGIQRRTIGRQPARRIIVAARARSNAAIARHDTTGIAREMMPGATVVSSTSAMATGASVNVSRMAATFARRPDTRWVRTADTIAVFDAWGVASERGHWVGTWTEPDGPVVIRGSYEAQWLRAAGTWRIQGELFVPLRCEGGAYGRARPHWQNAKKHGICEDPHARPPARAVACSLPTLVRSSDRETLGGSDTRFRWLHQCLGCQRPAPTRWIARGLSRRPATAAYSRSPCSRCTASRPGIRPRRGTC